MTYTKSRTANRLPELLYKTDELHILGYTFPIYGTITKPLFSTIDVVEALGYSGVPSRTIHRKVDKMDTTFGYTLVRGGRKKVLFITRFGLYTLVASMGRAKDKKLVAEVKNLMRVAIDIDEYSIEMLATRFKMDVLELEDYLIEHDIEYIGELQKQLTKDGRL